MPKTKTRLVQKPTRPKPAPVIARQSHAWSKALELAGGDASRLQVLSPTEVLVRNRPRPANGNGKTRRDESSPTATTHKDAGLDVGAYTVEEIRQLEGQSQPGVVDVLRNADGPLTIREIAATVKRSTDGVRRELRAAGAQCRTLVRSRNVGRPFVGWALDEETLARPHPSEPPWTADQAEFGGVIFSHADGGAYPCTVPGCSQTSSSPQGRGAHLRAAHGIAGTSRRRSA